MSRVVVGFAGMTHLGTVSCVAAAAKGFQVVGFDPDSVHAKQMRSGETGIVEPDLPEMIEASRDRMEFSDDPAALRRCDLVYVACDVPTNDQGVSDLGKIEDMLALIIPSLRPDAILVILSQVPPGFTRSKIRPDLHLFYQVETLIFGRALDRALHPEQFIIGCAAPSKGLPAAYADYLDAFGCPISTMRFESAELAKISINLFLLSSINTTNTIAELCERIGADWEEVMPVLRRDKRIGPHAYIHPGLGVSGGNLERDLITATRIGEAHGAHTDVFRAFASNSAHRAQWLVNALGRVPGLSVSNATIALLGLAYKENTASTKNSPALSFLKGVPDSVVNVYDPVVVATPEWHAHLHPARTALGACEDADVLVIATPWPEFSELEAIAVRDRMRGKIVIDPYRMLDRDSCENAGLRVYVMGAPFPQFDT